MFVAQSLCNEDYWTELAATVSRQASSLHIDSVRHKLADLRQRIEARHPHVDRIEFALYDPGMHTARNVFASQGSVLAPDATSRPLSQWPMFERVARSRHPMVVNDIPGRREAADDPRNGAGRPAADPRISRRSSPSR